MSFAQIERTGRGRRIVYVFGMNYLPAFLALLAAHGGMNADKAARTASAFARRLEIDQPLTVKSAKFGPAWDSYDPPVWHISFQISSDKSAYLNVEVTPAGRILYLCAVRGPQKSLPQGVAQFPSTIADAHRLFRRVWDGRPVVETPTIGTGEGQVLAQFDLVVNGLRFYNINPTYCDYVGFDPGGTANRWYAPSPPLPPVAAPAPRIGRFGAIARVESAVKPALDASGGESFVVGIAAKATLGYFMVKGEKAARLVWVVDISHILDLSGTHIDQFWRTVYVDAHSGAAFWQKDPDAVEMLSDGDENPH